MTVRFDGFRHNITVPDFMFVKDDVVRQLWNLIDKNLRIGHFDDQRRLSVDTPQPTTGVRQGRVSQRLAFRLTRWLLALGSALRLWQYVYDRPLWMDEAMLALNIAARGPVELLLPLDFNQAAPLLSFQVERLAATTLGVHEQAEPCCGEGPARS